MKPFFLSTALLFVSCIVGAQVSLVHDFNAGTGNSNPSLFTIHSNKVYFFAYDAVNGKSIWEYDGGNAHRIMSFDAGSSDVKYDFEDINRPMAIVGNEMFFTANTSNGFKLFRFNGVDTPKVIPANTAPVGYLQADRVLSLNNKIYFIATSDFVTKTLWMYDPAVGVAQEVKTIGNYVVHRINNIIAFNDQIVFSARANNSWSVRDFLFVYDIIGDSVRTIPLIDPRDFVRIGNKIYFSAEEYPSGRELYEYDGVNAIKLTSLAGTKDGVKSSTNYVVFTNVEFSLITPYNGKIYFQGSDDSVTVGWNRVHFLYAYDPATNQAWRVDSTGVYDPRNLTVFNGKLYYFGKDSSSGSELRVYDGLSQPSLVVDLFPGSGDGCANEMFIYNNDLYFAGNNGTTGFELYRLEQTNYISTRPKSQSLQLYPNPSNGHFTVHLKTAYSGKWNIELFNMVGQKLYASGWIQNQEYQVHLDDNFPGGMYFARIAKSGEIETIPVRITR